MNIGAKMGIAGLYVRVSAVTDCERFSNRVYYMIYIGTYKDATVENECGFSGVEKCIRSGKMIRMSILCKGV